MNLSINKYHGSYNISTRTSQVKYIVIHYVGAGTSAPGNAKNNCIYFSGGNRNASAHYFIDDSGIWEYADPKQYATWHCGDGGGKYGITNQNSIGIEVCINGDNPFTSAEINYLNDLVKYLMQQFGINSDRIVRHYDASRKQCPLYYVNRPSEWENLKRMITGENMNKWIKDSTGWWYKHQDGSYTTNNWEQINDHWYYFNAKGYAVTGWQLINNRWYYFYKESDHKTECAMATTYEINGQKISTDYGILPI